MAAKKSKKTKETRVSERQVAHVAKRAARASKSAGRTRGPLSKLSLHPAHIARLLAVPPEGVPWAATRDRYRGSMPPQS